MGNLCLGKETFVFMGKFILFSMQSPMTCLLYEWESNADTKVTIL